MKLDLDLLEWQFDFLESEATVKALSGASDTGKSWICRLHLVLTCLKHPNSFHFATATTHQQTFRAIIEPTIQFLEQHNISHVAQLHKGEGFIQFYNGSRIEIFSTDNMFHRLRSREFSMGFLEETSTIPDKDMEKIYYEAIRRLRQPGMPHHLLMATNPDLKTRWLYLNFFDHPPEDSWVRMLAFKDGYNRNDQEREAKILMGSKRQVDMFYHGLWGNLEGQAYVLDERHIRPVDTNAEGLDQFYITFDYGFHPDPQVYLLTSVKNGVIFILDEVVLDSVPVHRHEAFIKPWCSRYNIIGYTGETAAGSGEIRDLLNRQGITYYATTKKRNVGWTTLSDLVEQGKLVIDPRCVHLIRSLGSMIWIGSTQGVDCEGEYDDPADAIRYFVMCNVVYDQIVDRFGPGAKVSVR